MANATVTEINIPTREEVDSETQVVFDNLKKGIGMVPNLYAMIGHSGVTLKSYLAFSGALSKGGYDKREIEAISLAISEENGCNYCLAAHTAMGKAAGFTEEEVVELRTASIEDAKLLSLTRLVRSIVKNRGEAEPEMLEEFFAQGYGKKALVEMVGIVAVMTLTNYLGRMTDLAIDFPAAKSL